MTHRVPEGARDLSVAALARVEGEGAMRIRLRDGELEEVAFSIYEPPRFFEGLLAGRRMDEPVDITARICGICPIAYQISAARAIEAACGVTIDEGPIRELRRLIYCGEWIESHALHVYLLHAPDFLGYDSAIALAKDHQEVVEQGLALRKAGTELVRVIGGRASHPVNLRLGGFYRAPSPAELAGVRPLLEAAREQALATVRLVATFDFPELEIDHAFVSLKEEGRYPIDAGRLVASTGLDAPVAAFDEHIVEEHVERSTALHARLSGHDGTFMVGPLARYALAREDLSAVARSAADEVGLPAVVTNPYQSIVVRAVETLEAVEEALAIIDAYDEPDRPAVDVPARAGTGYGASEAPRGILTHRYTIDDDGIIVDARIVPPTAQNQLAVEGDLTSFIDDHRHLDDETLRWQLEQAIRNYDPCISCATHFLDLTVERE